MWLKAATEEVKQGLVVESPKLVSAGTLHPMSRYPVKCSSGLEPRVHLSPDRSSRDNGTAYVTLVVTTL
jgi:hypothetical protein